MSLRPVNKYEIVRKSIYHRKYYLDKVIFNLTKKYDMYITANDKKSFIAIAIAKDYRKCKNEVERKMVKSLDAVPYKEKHSRNAANTKQKLSLGVSKHGKSCRVRK